MSISAVDTQNFAADSDPHYEDRINLAAVFRMTARLDMHESVANHFSYAVSDDASQFLINPRGRHFSNVRASELLLLDANDESTMAKPDAPDPTASSKMIVAISRFSPIKLFQLPGKDLRTNAQMMDKI